MDTPEQNESRWEDALRKGIEVFFFLLVIAVFPYTDDPSNDIKYAILSWAALLLTSLWMVGLWRGGLTFRRPALFLEVLLLFLGLHVAASLRGQFTGFGMVEVGHFWSLFLIYLVSANVYRTPAQIRRFMLVACIAVAVSSLYGLLLQRTGHDPFPWSDRTSDEYLNIPGTFGNPNFAAHALILVLIMSLYLATRLNMIWCLALSGLFLVHLRITEQRAGIVALAAALGLVLMAKLVFARARRPVRAVAAVLLMTGLLGLAGGAGLMAVSKVRTGTPYPLDLSLLIRYKSYVSASEMILRQPLLGYGTGAYKIAYPQFWTPYEQNWFAQELKMNAHVHNDLLEVATDAGLPAAGLYLALLVLAASYGLLIACTAKEPLRRRLGFTFAAFFCAFLVDGLFGFNLRVPVSAALLFILLGCLEGYWGARTELPPKPIRAWWGRTWRVAVIALAVLAALLESRVFASRTLYQRGIGQLYGQQYKNAETLLGWGESLYPWSSDFARQRGLAALGSREWEAAIAHLDRSLQLSPWYIMSLVPLAQAHLSQGLSQLTKNPPDTAAALTQFEQGRASAERALNLSPTFAPAEDLLGRLAAAKAMALSASQEKPEADVLQAWREAKAHFGAAIEYGAKHPGEIYRQLAQVHIALGEREQAEATFIRATQADPSDEEIWPSFYRFAKDAKRYDGFRKALLWRITRLAEMAPPDTQSLSTAYLWLGGVEEERGGNLDDAEAAYRNAIHHTPRRPDVWAAYDQFAERAGRLESFKQYLIETNSQTLQAGVSPLPHINALAKVYRGEPNALLEASAVLVAVVQGEAPVPGLQPKDLALDWMIQTLHRDALASALPDEDKGIILFHLGLTASAIENDNLANAIFPGAMTLLTPDQQKLCAQHWADTLVRLGSPTEAVGLLRDVLSKVPGDPDVTLSLGRACYRAGDVAEAVKTYQSYLAMPGVSQDERARAQRELDAIQAQNQPGG